MAIRQLPDGRWICYYRKDGKWIRKYFGRGAAGQKAAAQCDETLGLARRRPKAARAGVTFGELALSYAENKNFNANSLRMLHYRLMANILPALGSRPAARLADEDLDRYIQGRRAQKTRSGRPIQYSTIRRELHDIKAILNWAARRRPALISRNPVSAYPVPAADDAVILPPTAAETAAILAAAPEHLRRAIYLAYFCGMRPGAVELLSLTWAAVNWTDQSIRIDSAAKGGPRLRLVPIHKELYKSMEDWYRADCSHPHPDPPPSRGREKIDAQPIVHYKGKMIKSIRHSWNNTLVRAGITRRLRPYDLRHNFVTRALEAGQDLKALSEVVGSRPETLMKHYQHVSKQMHRNVVDAIPSLVPQIRTKNDPNTTSAVKPQVSEKDADFRHVAQGESATLTRFKRVCNSSK